MSIKLRVTSRTTQQSFTLNSGSLWKMTRVFAEQVKLSEREIFDVFVDSEPYRINIFAHTLMILMPIIFCVRRGSFVIFPYTKGKRKLSLSVLPWNGKSAKYYVWEYLAALLAGFLNLVTRQPVLIFEKYSNYASDSGFLTYQYLRQHYSRLPVYYLIRAGSRDIGKFQHDSHVIIFGSFRHLLYLCRAQLFVSTEGKGHSYFWGERNGLVARAVKLKKYYFLQHGVIGFKRIDGIFSAASVYAPQFFEASSQFERELIEQNLGYAENPDKRVVITGLPRFDVIGSTSHDKKYIVFFYTWRQWLERKDIQAQLKSQYAQHLKAVATLAKGREDIKIIVHPKLQALMKSEVEQDEGIFVDNTKISIKEVLDQAKILVTDYSSVSWEAYYREVPVIFDMFDEQRYSDEIGSYLDLANPPFGEKIDVIHQWNRVVGHPTAITPEEKSHKPFYFEYEDGHNTERCAGNVLKIIGAR